MASGEFREKSFHKDDGSEPMSREDSTVSFSELYQVIHVTRKPVCALEKVTYQPPRPEELNSLLFNDFPLAESNTVCFICKHYSVLRFTVQTSQHPVQEEVSYCIHRIKDTTGYTTEKEKCCHLQLYDAINSNMHPIVRAVKTLKKMATLDLMKYGNTNSS